MRKLEIGGDEIAVLDPDEWKTVLEALRCLDHAASAVGEATWCWGEDVIAKNRAMAARAHDLHVELTALKRAVLA